MATDFYDVAVRDFERREEMRERRQRRSKRCYNCSEPIEQNSAVHIELTIRNKPVDLWFCDDCIEEMKERTDYDDED